MAYDKQAALKQINEDLRNQGFYLKNVTAKSDRVLLYHQKQNVMVGSTGYVQSFLLKKEGLEIFKKNNLLLSVTTFELLAA